jgi:hypothetical protein
MIFTMHITKLFEFLTYPEDSSNFGPIAITCLSVLDKDVYNQHPTKGNEMNVG